MTEAPLEPCPFCGGRAIFIGNGVGSKVFGIVCCGIQDCLGYHWQDGEYGGYTHATSKAEAVAAWNTRSVGPARGQPGGGASLMAAQVMQAHEWGYRDPVVGGFVEDRLPFDLADAVLGPPEAAAPNPISSPKDYLHDK